MAAAGGLRRLRDSFGGEPRERRGDFAPLAQPREFARGHRAASERFDDRALHRRQRRRAQGVGRRGDPEHLARFDPRGGRDDALHRVAQRHHVVGRHEFDEPEMGAVVERARLGKLEDRFQRAGAGLKPVADFGHDTGQAARAQRHDHPMATLHAALERRRNRVGQLSHAPRRADKDHLRLHRDCHWQFTWRERPSNVGGRIVSRAVLDAGFSTGLCVVCLEGEKGNSDEVIDRNPRRRATASGRGWAFQYFRTHRVQSDRRVSVGAQAARDGRRLRRRA